MRIFTSIVCLFVLTGVALSGDMVTTETQEPEKQYDGFDRLCQVGSTPVWVELFPDAGLVAWSSVRTTETKTGGKKKEWCLSLADFTGKELWTIPTVGWHSEFSLNKSGTLLRTKYWGLATNQPKVLMWFDVRTGKVLNELALGSRSSDISPDDQMVAFCKVTKGTNPSIPAHNLMITGKHGGEERLMENGVLEGPLLRDIRFTPDGAYLLATVSHYKNGNAVMCWNPKSGKKLWEIMDDDKEHPLFAGRLAFDPGGQRMSLTNEFGRAGVWTLNGEKKPVRTHVLQMPPLSGCRVAGETITGHAGTNYNCEGAPRGWVERLHYDQAAPQAWIETFDLLGRKTEIQEMKYNFLKDLEVGKDGGMYVATDFNGVLQVWKKRQQTGPTAPLKGATTAAGTQ